MFTFLENATWLPAWTGAPDWLSTRVFACGIAAIGLAVLALALKGMQKVITLLMAAALILGAVWFVQDKWKDRQDVLPPDLAVELNALAERTLKSAESRAAWEDLQSGWLRLHGNARARLAGGGDPARAAVAKGLDAKAAELRRNGKKAASEELTRLRTKVAPSRAEG